MKVRELQQQLSKLDPDLEVLCYSENVVLKGREQVLLDIEAISAMHGEQIRLDDGTLYLKFGKGTASAVFAILEVTSNF
jgi:hypothetical protein